MVHPWNMIIPNIHSLPGGCFGATNANGPSPSQQEASLVHFLTAVWKYLSQFIALVVGLSFLNYILSRHTTALAVPKGIYHPQF